MASLRDIARNPRLWNDLFLPKPDVVRYGAALGGAAFASPLGANGRGQAFFLMPSATLNAVGGLQVYLKESLAAGGASNGWAVSVVVGLLNTVVVDAGYKTIIVNRTAAATLATLKAVIDAAATGLESRYYSGETGASTSVVGELVTDNGHEPVNTWVRVVCGNNIFAFISENAPVNSAEAELVSLHRPFLASLRPNERIWIARQGSTNRGASIAVWKLKV